MIFLWIFLGLYVIYFCYKVWDKKRLIKAVLIQLSDEMTRTEHLECEFRTENIDRIMAKYVLDGGVSLTNARSNVLLEASNDDLLTAATKITEFRKEEYPKVLYQIQTLRFILDSMDALIGDSKSLEVAWTKSIRYLERYYTELFKQKAIPLPWIMTFPKLMGLPYNINDKFFPNKLIKANCRHRPKGWIYLYFACRLGDFTSDLKYGVMIRSGNSNKWIEKLGSDAWRAMLTYKAWHHHRVNLIYGTVGS